LSTTSGTIRIFLKYRKASDMQIGRQLAKIFTEKIIRDKQKRDKKIDEAVEKHLYSQREIAAHLGLHYTSISRIINERG
jgi:hypothetical protein